MQQSKNIYSTIVIFISKILIKGSFVQHRMKEEITKALNIMYILEGDTVVELP